MSALEVFILISFTYAFLSYVMMLFIVMKTISQDDDIVVIVGLGFVLLFAPITLPLFVGYGIYSTKKDNL